MMVPINRNLLLALAVRHSKGGANFYFSRVRDCSKQRPDDSSLFILSSEIVIKDRKKSHWMNGDQRNLSPGDRHSINAALRAEFRTHAWFGVELKACW